VSLSRNISRRSLGEIIKLFFLSCVSPISVECEEAGWPSLQRTVSKSTRLRFDLHALNFTLGF